MLSMKFCIPVLVLMAVFSCSPEKSETTNTRYIDPFICTGGDHGQTDVAAAVPFGMVKPCPDSDPMNHSGYDLFIIGNQPEIRKIFQATPHGYISEMDDDAGTMSAWYLLSSMGLFQTCPGESYFWVTIPLFRSVKINLPCHKTFEIKIEGEMAPGTRIKKLSLNGEGLDEPRIDFREIHAGGELIIETESI